MRSTELRTSTDAIVRMLRSVDDGVLGHHGVGVVEQVGSRVRQFAVGDSVLVACIGACGFCAFCLKFMYSHCTTGGWILAEAHSNPGADAGVIPESNAAMAGVWSALVSIPHADTSLTHLPVAGSRGRSVTLMAHRSRLKRILDAYGRIRPTLDDDYYVVESQK